MNIEFITKGEWVVGQGTIKGLDGEHIGVALKENTKKIIASTGFVGASDEVESLANATLIAAAPDMYEKLLKLKKWLQMLLADAKEHLKTCRFESLNKAYRSDIKNFEATIADIDKALNKAEGK